MRTERPIDVRGLPADRQDAFRELAEVLDATLSEALLALVAFGGWVADDRCYEQEPGTSALIVDQVDLEKLDGLSGHGRRFGPRGLAAPLIMTPAYIHASRDVFPLEFLEIQQLHKAVIGESPFGALSFAPADMRLQAERELKSALIQMRQGLMAAAGSRTRLDEVCGGIARRALRVVRGVLYLAGKPPPRLGLDLLSTFAEHSGLQLATLGRAAVGASGLGFDGFRKCYEELAALTTYVDELKLPA